MSPTPSPDAAAVLRDAPSLRLVEVPPPPVPPRHREAADLLWEAETRARPEALFDGPVVVCASLAREADGGWALAWAPAAYRHFTLRRVPGATPLPSVFVTVVQPDEDGALLVGRTGPATAVPGRWQLPGGSVEPPNGGPLDLAELGRQAARELAEETGTRTPPGDLVLWAVSEGEYGNVGVHFRAPPLPAAALRASFADLLAAERAAGRRPEFAACALINAAADLATFPHPHADYLAPVLHRWTHS
ncbi:NUDIX domain-containing protein [Actinocorallia herbida]|uniref:NUDIX domain-containing protein n=1 Tax=Actinocorallia herbida TaxID=58109 RepID=A0A3N1CVG0_9ACTN|nr:NUDIX domain-containing protein [Actinocorallia herbida]ROO85267.1 NUDIX domain-containing protein [Actinocorallia herbida]